MTRPLSISSKRRATAELRNKLDTNDILDPGQVRHIRFSTVQHPYSTPPMISLSAVMDPAKSGDVLPSSLTDIAPYEDQNEPFREHRSAGSSQYTGFHPGSGDIGFYQRAINDAWPLNHQNTNKAQREALSQLADAVDGLFGGVGDRYARQSDQLTRLSVIQRG